MYYTFIIILILNLTSAEAEVIRYKDLFIQLEKKYQKVNDYSCYYYKNEYIDGKYILKNNIYYKFKKPHYYYLKWTEGEDQGMEVIYAGAKYNKKLKVHLNGIIGLINLSLDPWGEKALDGCRHSVLESDFGHMISMLKANCEKARGLKGFTVSKELDEIINEVDSHVYKFQFPDHINFYGKTIYLGISKTSGLPSKLVVYDGKKLIEEYMFNNLKINNGFTEMDFDINNPDYDY